MATKKPTLNDLPVILARIADSLEQLTGAPLAKHDPVKPVAAPPKSKGDMVVEEFQNALPTAQLPVAAPATEAPAVSEPAVETQTAPTNAEPKQEPAPEPAKTDTPTLESLQKTVQNYVRGVEGDPNPPDVETQNKRMNQVQGLLLKSGKPSLDKLTAEELVAFASGMVEFMKGDK